MDMVIMLCLRWWYGVGWGWVWKRAVVERTQWLMETFSIAALIRTWFSPFKQTYSSGGKGSIDLKIQAAVDSFISRIIGSIARTVIIFTGLTGVLLAFISGVFTLIVWPALPLLPIIGIFLAISGAGV